MADELIAKLVVDTSQLRPGMKEAASVIQDSSQEMARAIAELSVASENARESMKRFGMDAAAGIQPAVDAIERDQVALEAATAAVERLEAAQRSQAASAAAAAQQSAAAGVLQAAAAGVGGQDELQLGYAAATQSLSAAKARQAEVAKAAAVANVEETTTLQALATAELEVTEATERAAGAKAALNERAEAEAANAVISERAAAADTTASAAAQRYARALIEKSAAQAELKAITESLSASTLDQATKEAALTPVLERNLAATLELAAAQKDLAAATTSTAASRAEVVAGMQAMSGSAGGAERAVGMLALKFPELAGAIATLGEVAGVGLLVYLLGQGVVAMEELREKGEQAGAATARSFGEVTQKLETADDELRLTNSRLADQIAKLEGTPGNGLETALLSDVVAADKLQASLAAVVKEIQEKDKANAVGYVEAALSGAAATKPVDDEIRSYMTGLEGRTQAEKNSFDQTLATRKEAHDRERAEAAGNASRLQAIDDAFHAQQLSAEQGHQSRLDAILKEGQEHLNSRAGEIQAKQDGPRGLIHGSKRSAMDDLLGTDDFSDQINRLRGAASALGAQRSVVSDTGAGQQLEAQKGALEQRKELAAQSRKQDSEEQRAARERLKGFEDARTAEVAAGKLGAQADLDFWAGKIQAFAQGSDQYRAIQAKMNADRKALASEAEQHSASEDRAAEATAKNAEAQALAGIRFDEATGRIDKVTGAQRAASAEAAAYTERLRILDGELKRIADDNGLSPEERQRRTDAVSYRRAQFSGEQTTAAAEGRLRIAQAEREEADRAAEAEARLAAAKTRGREIDAQNAEQSRLAEIAVEQQTGKITGAGAAYEAAAAHAAYFRQRLVDLRQELENLKKEQANLQPGTGAWNQNQTNQQNVQNAIGQLGGRQSRSAQGDLTALTNQIAKPYLAAFNEVETGFMRMQQMVLTGHKTFGQAMQAVEQQWAMAAIEAIEKRLFRSIEADVLTTARHAAERQMQTTIDAAGASEATAVTGRENLKQITSDAAAAAAKAYKAMAGIPVVGPELGAVAAAATFIAVEGFGAMASFDSGTPFIPGDIVAQLHAGERVVTERGNARLDGLLDSHEAGNLTGGGKPGHTFNSTVNYHNHGSRNPSASEVAYAVKKQGYRLMGQMPPR